mmetsp:Transcript_11121/g.23395  ORF Transcript_11121/g.23395 Transcript_11121/m.23395 type:complete len:265 (-) Transcript_11121:42-836(-)
MIEPMDDAPVQPFQIAFVREFFRCVIVIVIIIIIVIIIVTAFQQGGIGELQRHRNHVKLARGRRRTAIAIRLVAFLAIQTPLAAAAAASSSPETNRHPLPQPPGNLTFGERTAADPEDRSFLRTLGSPIGDKRRTAREDRNCNARECKTNLPSAEMPSVTRRVRARRRVRRMEGRSSSREGEEEEAEPRVANAAGASTARGDPQGSTSERGWAVEAVVVVLLLAYEWLMVWRGKNEGDEIIIIVLLQILSTVLQYSGINSNTGT